ncbi:MAG: hypothetical protein M1827_005155 [Pycnora praestabilis]|nr:MAG: hypothetical protein M1827_005155 [Pycnora praestabilis]
MATSFISYAVSANTLSDLAKLSQSIALDDIAVLSVIALGTAGYLLRGIAWDKPDPYHHVWFERPQEKDAAGRQTKKETRNIAQKLEEAGKDLVIFWGSQSGTAEGFANRLARECHLRFGLDTMTADLSDYDSETIALIPSTKLAFFIISTYGEGDPSDNAAAFWGWIHKSSDVSLSNLRYMAFGLGNRNYKYYNRVIDVVTEALDKFGASALSPVGRADDSTGATEEDFMDWKESLFAVFRKDLQYEEKEVLYEPTLSVIEDDSMDIIDLHVGEPVQQRGKSKAASYSPIQAVPVKHSKELFTTSDRNCLHMELDLSHNPEIKYKTGDHLAVWPTNSDIEVDRLLRVLGLTKRGSVPISILSLDPAIKTRIPTPTNVESVFRYYLEICSPVPRDTILSLVQFAPTPSAKLLLSNLGKDKDAYAEFLSHNVLTIGRLLEIASEGCSTWDNLPLSFLLEVLPLVNPRYYSISSSSIVQPRQAAITAVVSTDRLCEDSNQRIFGLTTNYLLALKQSLNHEGNCAQPHPHGLTYALNGPGNALENGKLFVNIRKSKFKLPFMAAHPLIMVAAGTGIAPFRAFLQERARLKTVGREIGKMILFFGCRNANEDFIYREELEQMQETLGDALKIVTAFSRQDKNADGSKMYVQDRVEEHAAEVCGLLNESNANFYICGSATMAREVTKRLGDELKEGNEWGDERLREWSEREKRLNRWQEDVWG